MGEQVWGGDSRFTRPGPDLSLPQAFAYLILTNTHYGGYSSSLICHMGTQGPAWSRTAQGRGAGGQFLACAPLHTWGRRRGWQARQTEAITRLRPPCPSGTRDAIGGGERTFLIVRTTRRSPLVKRSLSAERCAVQGHRCRTDTSLGSDWSTCQAPARQLWDPEGLEGPFQR